MKPLIVMGLDLSLTRTGYALGSATGVVTCKAKGMPRLQHIRETVMRFATALGKADLVAVEGYSFGSRDSQAHALGELGGVIRLALHEARVPYADIPPTCLKKYATGTGNANKEAVLAEAIRRLGYAGSDNNEADALWLRAMALDHYGRPVVQLPEKHRQALEKVEWPAIPE